MTSTVPDLDQLEVLRAGILRAVTDTAYGTFVVPGTTHGSVRIETAGNVTITDAYPSATIANGNIVRVDHRYPLI